MTQAAEIKPRAREMTAAAPRQRRRLLPLKTLDRYVLRQFLTNFVILLVVFSLLFVVVNVVVNLDEFLDAGQKLKDEFPGGAWAATVWAIADYNGPMIILLYVFFSGLLVMAAMSFTFAGLHRTGELTAMIAGGVSLYRVAAPVLIAGFVLAALSLPSQEFLIPPLAQKLNRSTSQVGRQAAKPFDLTYVVDANGHLLSAARFHAETQTLEGVTILMRDEHGLTRLRITAPKASWDAGRSAWVFTRGIGIQPGPRTTNRAIESFETSLTPEVLLAQRISTYPRFLGLRQLQRLADNPTIDGNQIRQIMHSRFSLLVMNVLVLVMCLKYFLTREPSNMLVQGVKASLVGMGAWSVSLVLLQAGSDLLNPAAGAWLPVVVSLPISATLLWGVKT